MNKKKSTYENGLILLLALLFGCLFIDRLALNFLMPYVSKDLGLNNTQIGILAGGLSLTWALSSFFTTAWAEHHHRKKIVFVIAVLLFSICSFWSGLATTFIILLISRLIMGVAEGPVVPLAQSFVERESSPHRLGVNAGILQAVGPALFGSILAPVLLVKIADGIGWRNAFYIAGIPGLMLGVMAWYYIKPSTAESKGYQEKSVLNISELLAYNNIRWGIPLACAVFGWWFATLPFISNYFVSAQGMSTDQMGKTMGLLGVAGLVSSIIIPFISDRFGRKKAILIAITLGIFYPLVIYFFKGSSIQLPLMFITYFMIGALPIVAAVIPTEAVPIHLKAKAVGLITASAEIVGGVIVPAVAGILTDKIDASAFLWVSVVFAVIAWFCIFKLKEVNRNNS